MSYATWDDLCSQIGEQILTDLVSVRGDNLPVMDICLAAAEQASQVIDLYLGSRYRLPVPKSALLTGWTCTLVRYDMDGGGLRATDDIKVARASIIAMLRDIQAGRADLPGVMVQSSAAPSTGADCTLLHSNDRLFSRTTLRGF